MSAKPNFSRVQREAARLLASTEQLPIPVERIAADLGFELSFDAVEEGLSGAAIRTPRGAIVSVNSGHPYRRQRFTIAHEIGHLLLHVDSSEFVDAATVVGYRVAGATSSIDETEANHFAAELLLPWRLVAREARLVRHLSLEEAIGHLASRFQVSEQAMTIRLSKRVEVLL